jgi:hypothetical protein
MQGLSGIRRTFLRSIFFILLAFATIFSSAMSRAQLIDPNNRCYYQPGSTVCQPLPTPAPVQQPSRPVVNQCESQCGTTQQQCMGTCTAQHDWYRCFAYCGDVRTTCMRGCPM